MKVLVTGASGFIGQELVRRLLQEGHEVRGLYRRETVPFLLDSLKKKFGPQLKLVRINLDFPQSVPGQDTIRTAMRSARMAIPAVLPSWDISGSDLGSIAHLFEGIDACVHTAALVGDWGSEMQFFSAHVVTTRLLLEASQKAGLERFVYISSLAVHGFGHNRKNTENGTYFKVTNPYQCSKRCAEAVVGHYGLKGLLTCTIRPGNVYGNGDTTTFYPIFDALMKGLMGTLASGRYLTCPVHVSDVVAAIFSSLTADLPARERTFNIVSGESVTWKTLVNLCCDVLLIRRTSLDMPGFIARIAALVLESSFKLFRAKNAPPLTVYRVEQLLHDYDFSIDRAMRVLAYQPQVNLSEGFKSCADAYHRDRELQE